MKTRRMLLAGMGAALIGGLAIGAAHAQTRPNNGPAPGGPVNGRQNGFQGPDGYNPGQQGSNNQGGGHYWGPPGSGRRIVDGPQPAGANISGGIGGRITNPNSLPSAANLR